MRIEIKSRYSATVLFDHEAAGNTLRVTVEKAVSAKADLGGRPAALQAVPRQAAWQEEAVGDKPGYDCCYSLRDH